jgi:exodeoxyribonuclease VII small subunit
MAKRKTVEQPSSVATFEDSLAELQAIVSELEEGSLGLETSLARFERGVNLLRSCYAILESVEQRVQILTAFNSAAEPTTVAFGSAASFEQFENGTGLEEAPVSDADQQVPANSDSEKPSLF